MPKIDYLKSDSILKEHDDIKFLTRLRDFESTIKNQKFVYLTAAIPSIFVSISLILNIWAVFKLSTDGLVILVLSFLFIYGLLNLWLATKFQRSLVRIEKQKSIAEILHRYLAHDLRDYLTFEKYQTKNKQHLNEQEIRFFIKRMLENLCEHYLKRYYRKAVTVTLKYRKNNHLYSIVVGKRAISNPSPSCESLTESYVYNALRRKGKRQSYIYIKNLEKIDDKERKMIAEFQDDIVGRATGRYKTLIALPIRWGELPTFVKTNLKSKPDLGIIGIDLMEPYGFGNFDDNEIHILLCFTDLVSKLVNDLIEL